MTEVRDHITPTKLDIDLSTVIPEASGETSAPANPALIPTKAIIDIETKPEMGLGSTPEMGLGSTPEMGLGSTPEMGLGSTPEIGMGTSTASLSGEERRRSRRHAVKKPVVLIPVLPDGRPDRDHRAIGVSRDFSKEGVGVEWESAKGNGTPSLAYMVGTEGKDGSVQFEGMEVRRSVPAGERRTLVGGRFGGPAHDLLQTDNLMPSFHPDTLTFGPRIAEEVIGGWVDLGVLQSQWLDRLQVCPRCRTLSTFRQGCRNCGSARITNDQLIHHFACAHVGPVSEYETRQGLTCPKCRTRQLIIGADFEYVRGPFHCLDCQWTDIELEQVAQCLRCGLRYPGHQAFIQEMRGYRANRLDPLALVPQS